MNCNKMVIISTYAFATQGVFVSTLRLICLQHIYHQRSTCCSFIGLTGNCGQLKIFLMMRYLRHGWLVWTLNTGVHVPGQPITVVIDVDNSSLTIVVVGRQVKPILISVLVLMNRAIRLIIQLPKSGSNTRGLGKKIFIF